MAKKSRAELKAERNGWRDAAEYWAAQWMELDAELVQRAGELGREIAKVREELNAAVEAKTVLQDALLRLGDEKRALSEQVAGLAVSLTASADSRDHWRDTAEAAGEKIAALEAELVQSIEDWGANDELMLADNDRLAQRVAALEGRLAEALTERPAGRSVAPMSEKIGPDEISRATRAMCRELYGDNFDLHDHGAQDPDGRAHLERAAEAALESWLDG